MNILVASATFLTSGGYSPIATVKSATFSFAFCCDKTNSSFASDSSLNLADVESIEFISASLALITLSVSLTYCFKLPLAIPRPLYSSAWADLTAS